MAYFSNGTAGMAYQERYCCRCTNYRDKDDGRGQGCGIWDAHLVFPSHHTPKGGKCEPSKESAVLDLLIPSDDNGFPAECTMFVGDGKDHDTLALPGMGGAS